MFSTSSIAKDYLVDRDEGFTFTSLSLAEAINTGRDPIDQIGEGPISGFLARLHKANVLVPLRKDGRSIVWALKDKAKLRSLVVKEKPGRGSQHPTRHVESLTTGPVTTKSVQERMLDLAAELERARSPLDAYSTRELLNEIQRRTEKV